MRLLPAQMIADTVRLVLYLVTPKEFGVPSAQLALALNNHRRLGVLAGRCAAISKAPGALCALSSAVNLVLSDGTLLGAVLTDCGGWRHDGSPKETPGSVPRRVAARSEARTRGAAGPARSAVLNEY